MKESHSQQLVILVGFIFVLIMAIAIPLVLSVLRKKKERSDETIAKVEMEGQARADAQTHIQAQSAQTPQPTQQIQPTVDVTQPTAVPVQESEPKSATLQDALKNTENHFWGRIKSALSLSGSKKRDDVLEQIEEILYTSDLGPALVETWLEKMKDQLSDRDLGDFDQVQKFLRAQMTSVLEPIHAGQIGSSEQNSIGHRADADEKQDLAAVIKKNSNGPTVVMIVGVNGAGKTTTIGKLSAHLASTGARVLVAAGDTFRAAAGGQLKGWTERAQSQVKDSKAGEVEIFWPPNVTDPAAVAFDSLEKARAQKFDYLLLDTAGRLHNQSHLMDELKKVKRVLSKAIADAPHETWVVLDGNAGQNAVLQAREFHQALQLSGIVLTKLDGTAKGGAAISAVHQLQIPIRLIGIGEKVNDLRLFNWSEFVDAIIGIKK